MFTNIQKGAELLLYTWILLRQGQFSKSYKIFAKSEFKYEKQIMLILIGSWSS